MFKRYCCRDCMSMKKTAFQYGDKTMIRPSKTGAETPIAYFEVLVRYTSTSPSILHQIIITISVLSWTSAKKWGAFRKAFAGWTRNQFLQLFDLFKNYHSLHGNESISHGSHEVWKLLLSPGDFVMLLHRRVLYHLKHHQHHIQLAVPQITILGRVGGMCAHVMCLIFTPKVFEEYLVKKRWLHSKRIYIKYPET